MIVRTESDGDHTCSFDQEGNMRLIEWSDGMYIHYAPQNKNNGGYIKHRIDGPAVRYPSGGEEYWLNGELKTKKEFKRLVKMKAFW